MVVFVGWGWGGIDFCEWSSEMPMFRVTATVSLQFVLFQETEHGAEKVRGQWGGGTEMLSPEFIVFFYSFALYK